MPDVLQLFTVMISDQLFCQYNPILVLLSASSVSMSLGSVNRVIEPRFVHVRKIYFCVVMPLAGFSINGIRTFTTLSSKVWERDNNYMWLTEVAMAHF